MSNQHNLEIMGKAPDGGRSDPSLIKRGASAISAKEESASVRSGEDASQRLHYRKICKRGSLTRARISLQLGRRWSRVVKVALPTHYRGLAKFDPALARSPRVLWSSMVPGKRKAQDVYTGTLWLNRLVTSHTMDIVLLVADLVPNSTPVSHVKSTWRSCNTLCS